MKKLLLLGLLLIPLPAQAITWKEFWEPFGPQEYYYPPPPRYDIPRPRRYCEVRILRKEWVPGYYINPWNYRSGYMNYWYEYQTVPCNRV